MPVIITVCLQTTCACMFDMTFIPKHSRYQGGYDSCLDSHMYVDFGDGRIVSYSYASVYDLTSGKAPSLSPAVDV